MHPNRLVILAPHEPWKDPRVHWAATAAVAAGHEVVVPGIREILGDHARRDRMASYRMLRHCQENARTFVREAFHWEAVCGPLLDAYGSGTGAPDHSVAPDPRPREGARP